MGIQINGNTNNINAGIGSLSIEDINELDIVGVATAANFKTGVSNLHSVGLTLSGGQIDVGSNIKIGTAGVVTATSFVGSGANLTGITVPGGATNLDLLDSSGTGNGRIRLGASQDLQIYHDGSHSWMANDTGRLILQTDGDQLQLRGTTVKLFNGAGNSTYASIDTNNHLLYTAGLERFRIYNDGVVAIGQSSKSSTVGAGGLDIQGNSTGCNLEMGNPFPSFSGGIVPEFRITALNSHTVNFESVWGGDNGLHKHLAFSGGSTIFYNGMSTTEVARFNSNKFGIGTASPSDQIHIAESGATHSYIRFSNSNISNGWSVGAQSGGRFQIVHNGVRDSFFIDTSGNATIPSGNLVMGTSGKGIDFSATSNANGSNVSELFSDYEEGSWTPQVLDGNGSNYTISKDANQTVYRRIGDMVFIFYNITRTENGSKTGILYIPTSSLPYSVTYGIGASGQFWVDHGNPGTGLGDIVGGHHNVGTSGVYFVKPTDKSGIGQASTRYLNHGQWSYGRPIYGSFSYRTS